MRYLVKDETGVAMRIFQTRLEAVAFMQHDWSLVVLPRKAKPNPFDLVGDCLFWITYQYVAVSKPQP